MIWKVAIVGRPNVGKSALFNRICNQRVAIVDELEGVTRDRIQKPITYFDKHFTLVDTGGIDSTLKKDFNEEVRAQALAAIEEADSLIFVVDSTIGVTVQDQEVAKIIHKSHKPCVVAINKVDNSQRSDEAAWPFVQLGFKQMVPVSATHGYQMAELLEEALVTYEGAPEPTLDTRANIAIVGRPNVGKSSLLNALLDEERSIVSPIPGTTRDAIDVNFEYGDTVYTLIDTAGIRRKKAQHDVVDKYAHIRSEEAIERCDIALLVLDAQQGLSEQDKRLLQHIEDQGKGCLILLNKWDLVEGIRMEHALSGLEQENPFVASCPKLIISAKTKRNLDKILPKVEEILSYMKERIGTGELNKFIEKTIQKQHPPMLQGKRLRIYYMTQVSSRPPTFVLFINHKELVHPTYMKYVVNQIREQFKFTGLPIRLIPRPRSESRQGDF